MKQYPESLVYPPPEELSKEFLRKFAPTRKRTKEALRKQPESITLEEARAQVLRARKNAK